MRKIYYLNSPPGAGRRRYVRTVLISLMLIFAAGQAGAQQVTLTVKDMPLAGFFRELRKQTGYSFLYNNATLKDARPVTLRVSGASLREVLDAALNGQPLTYSISNKTVILKTAPVRRPDQPLVSAQDPVEIKGRLTDEKTKEPVVGATVMVKGTSTGMVSGLKGEFAIRMRPGDQLQVSYMGYETVLVTPKAGETQNITLRASQQSIKDVVVTGMFSRPKQNFTGAASSFTRDDLNKVTNGNVLTALSALDPSFQMPDNLNFGSNPNMLPEVTLRGGNSLVDIGGAGNTNTFNYANSPNVPLFILDGFEVNLQRINDIDLNRIAKVDILKDAAATSIYGSRAANGVIVIETIRPQSGKLTVTYNGNVNVELPDLRGYDLLNAREKLDLELKTGAYNYSWNTVDEQLKLYYQHRLSEVERGVNTDWLSQPLRAAFGQKHNIYVEGGGNDALYGVNLSYDQREGVMKESDRRNIMAGTYLSYRYKNLQFRNDLNLGFNKSTNSPYGHFRQYTQLNPYWTPYDTEGNMKVFLEEVYGPTGNRLTNFDQYDNLDGQKAGRAVNPLYNTSLNLVDQKTYYNITNNFALIWQAKPWLRVNARLAYSRQNDEADNFKPAQHTSFVNTQTFEKGSYSRSTGSSTTLEGFLGADVNKSIGRHLFFGTLAANVQEQSYNYATVRTVGFPNPRMDEFILGSKYAEGDRPFGMENRSRLAGFVGNLSYAYDNRYLLDFSYRVDGSSRFGAERRFAPFWSTGIGYNLHKETFIQNIAFINRLKLRYSFGYTGSQNFDSYLGVTTSQYYPMSDYRGVIGTGLMGYGNTALGWQQTRKNNLGADITLFNRLDITANYFIERTQGSIARISTAPSTGFSYYYENMGDVLNKGWEVNARLNIINSQTNRDNWSVFVNAFHVKNSIERISNTIAQMNKRADTTLSSTPLPRYAAGQSTSAIWVVPSLGIDPSTGMEIFVTRDGRLTNTYSPLDQVIMGDSRPEVEGTFGTNAEIRGIGLNVYFRFRFGGQTYNQTLIDRVENVNAAYYNVDRRVAEERWMKPGDVVFFKGVINAGGFVNGLTRASSRFVQDDNELSCESLSIYYRFPDRMLNKAHLKNTRITFFTADLFRFSSVKRERGLDYPFSKSYTLQIQTSF
ncbi:SusC/RagA family TonB-linked outer membrane protein [Chitinophaga barathri]|uniref:SusC/RagA family TonB-linked outer membrane protein n=1 Tax=Chitinophaga barathri TaxID=1647451 RepID=A0A3N4M8C1_9BACT|nr:SusC/RagA family TonB-linked outer membrane protein [Chitinophaga barathri]RPD39618.1 SusC/RagA family TonB-linked outer membrane protein [Chitinophaga barathri]